MARHSLWCMPSSLTSSMQSITACSWWWKRQPWILVKSWPPSSVLSDFEQALIRLNFPTAQHRGCYYHYSQAIWQKVQALGVWEEYKAEDEILKSFVQKTAAICFIPPAYIRVAWQGLQYEAPDIDRIDDFVEYFDRTWINGQYRISQWNYYDYHGPELIS